MSTWHRLLARQISKHFGAADTIPKNMLPLLEVVNEAYHQFDRDQKMIERSLDISSQELLDKNGELNLIFESLPDYFIWLDTSGRILRTTSCLPANLYCMKADAVGKMIQEAMPPHLSALLHEYIKRMVKNPGLLQFEYDIQENDKKKYFVARLLLIRPSILFLILSDVTEKKEYEARVLEIANAKSDFLALVSHEIRTPLNSVLGFLELLKGTQTTHEQTQYIDDIEESGNMLLTIINETLHYFKIESGEISLDNISFNIRELLGSIEHVMNPAVAKNGLFLKIEASPHISEFIMSDPTKLKQILINLIGNAAKFTHEGGITLKVNTIPAASASLLVFSVHDTGIGISPDKKEKIFKPFTQGDESITRKYGGTGLGLSICKSLVEIMRGELTLRTEIGKGSEFSFTIPYMPQNGSALETTCDGAQNSAALKKLRILVVEDNELNQKLMKALCQKIGCAADFADNGLIACEILNSGKHYDLCLMDLQMPVMSGIDAAKYIRHSLKNTKLPTIALTAHALENDKKACEAVGINYFLTKPIRMDTLIPAIRKAVLEK